MAHWKTSLSLTMVILLLCPAATKPAAKTARSKPEKLFVHHASVLRNPLYAKRVLWVTTLSFDLSPDGKTLATQLRTGEGQNLEALTVALWDVDTQQLKALKRLEGPGEAVLPGHAQYATQVRFTPEGRRLIVLTAQHLSVLAFPDLSTLYSVEAAIAEDSAPKMFIDKFSIAAQANRLALLWIDHKALYRGFEVQVLDLTNGKSLHLWRKAGEASSVCLSPDGSRVAVLMNPVNPGVRMPANMQNLFVFDSATGEAVQAINTGSVGWGAQFVGDGSKLATIPAGPSEKHLRVDTIRFWEVSSGRLLREIGYDKYGVRGSLSVSQQGNRIAAITHWCNPFFARLDLDCRGFTRWLLWGQETEKPLFVSPDLEEEPLPGSAESSYLIRLSADGSRFAVGGQTVTVYAFPPR